MIDVAHLPPWPCCGARGHHAAACRYNPANLYYCPECDEFGRRRDHFLCRHLTAIALAAAAVVMVAPLVLLYLLLTGPAR